MERGIFFDSGNHEADYIEKCSDKIAIEICKSYEYLTISNAYKGFLILYSFNLLRIYANAFGRND